MRRTRALFRRLAGMFAGPRDEDELRAELETHLEMETAENVRRGMSPKEARRQALLASGGVTRAAERVREQRGLPWLERVLRDHDQVPELAQVMGPWWQYLREVAGGLAAGWGVGGHRQRILRASVGHALDFLNLAISLGPRAVRRGGSGSHGAAHHGSNTRLKRNVRLLAGHTTQVISNKT